MFVSTELHVVCSCSKRQRGGENQGYAAVSQSTWVPKEKLTHVLADLILDGKASYQKLQQLALKSLEVLIPLRAHPQTKPQTKTVFFTQTPSTEPASWAIVESAGAATLQLNVRGPNLNLHEKEVSKRSSIWFPTKPNHLCTDFCSK